MNRRQAITSANLSSIGPMHTDFKYNLIDNSNIFIQENALQMLSIKYHPNSPYFIVSNIPYLWLVRNIKWEYQRTLQK